MFLRNCWIEMPNAEACNASASIQDDNSNVIWLMTVNNLFNLLLPRCTLPPISALPAFSPIRQQSICDIIKKPSTNALLFLDHI
jgi:hypothetical protein